MTTYGTLERVIEKMQRTYHEKVANRQKTFQYPEELLKHFNDCDSVDSHNSSLMDPISLEETRNTTRWPVRVFMFLLDTTEANCQLATENIYDHPACFQQEFRRLIPEALIKNNYIHQDKYPRHYQRGRQFLNDNELVQLQKYRTFKKITIFTLKMD